MKHGTLQGCLDFVSQAKEFHSHFDANQDGVLSFKEFTDALAQISRKGVIRKTKSSGKSAIPKSESELESAMAKLVTFMKRDRKNPELLSAVFIQHEQSKKESGTSAPGLPIDKLMSAFGNIGVGFNDAEVWSFEFASDVYI